jgi:predicted MFS family arabinose efflux permease
VHLNEHLRSNSAWSRLSAGFVALRHRDFFLLWGATFISNAGSWMQKVTTSWLIYQMTGSKTWLGIDAFASGFTTVILLPVGGVIADKFDRRRLLIWTNSICAILALALAAFAGLRVLHVWHIITASALSGVVQAALVPASTSLLPALVGEDDVPNAIALNSFQFNLSRAIGPIIAGVTLIHFGSAWSFGFNALSFLVLAAAFLIIRTVPPVPPSKLPFGSSLLEGMRFVRARRDLIILLLLVAATALFGAPVVSLLPALTSDVLHRSAQSYSFLLSCFGIGAILAAIAAGLIGERLAQPIVIMAAVTCVGVCEIFLAFSHWSLAVLIVGIAGMAFVGVMIQLGTTILQTTDDAYRGRVTSLQQVCFRAGQPLGAVVAGIIGQHWGIQMSFWTFGAALIGISALALMFRNTDGETRTEHSKTARPPGMPGALSKE